ncbi:unnamed protein product [Darwinula stevensoni]|uniref:Chitin-binding type-2 domain-containing protein n=1 Tax=Darwinula stevensoni TaxID=69355 RepID=A0A7R9ADQ7_9CRUS|nr:unnamed protein product [Darwinula stevensoni]CAG0900989.1 unnamed protein product [Darwinula stevensoni]
MRFSAAAVAACLLALVMVEYASAIPADLKSLKGKELNCQCGCEVFDDECRNPETEDEYFSHPEDCGSFCGCHMGTAYYYICPDELVFNEEAEYCDWPANVECEAPMNPDVCLEHDCLNPLAPTTPKGMAVGDLPGQESKPKS